MSQTPKGPGQGLEAKQICVPQIVSDKLAAKNKCVLSVAAESLK